MNDESTLLLVISLGLAIAALVLGIVTRTSGILAWAIILVSAATAIVAATLLW